MNNRKKKKKSDGRPRSAKSLGTATHHTANHYTSIISRRSNERSFQIYLAAARRGERFLPITNLETSFQT